MRWQRQSRRSADIRVSEKAGIRYLHLNSDTIQSAMRLRDPEALVLAYSRAMMAWQLFLPQPQRVLLVGLGGGSLVKHMLRALPQTQVEVVELLPEMVGVAQGMFEMPVQHPRLTVHVANACDRVPRYEGVFDVIMLDAYDGHQLAPDLATESFYLECRRALTERGLLVSNLWGSDPAFTDHLQKLERCFDQRTLCLPVREKGNVVVFSLQQDQGDPKWDELRQRALVLQAQEGLEFTDFVTDLAKMNLHTEKRLLI